MRGQRVDDLPDEAFRCDEFADNEVVAERHRAKHVFVDHAACETLAELALGIDDLVGADEPQDAGVNVVVGARNHAAGAKLLEQCGRNDGCVARPVADGNDTDIAGFGGAAHQGLFVGGVETDRFGHKRCSLFNEFHFTVDGQDLYRGRQGP